MSSRPPDESTTDLRLEPVVACPDTTDLLYPIYASNIDFLRLTDDVADPLPRDGFERSLKAEFDVPDQQFLRVRDSDEPVGLAAFLAPHPKEPHPWIGLLMIDGTRQRTGLGRATATLVEQRLAVEGRSRDTPPTTSGPIRKATPAYC
jgi:hypothetical protein